MIKILTALVLCSGLIGCAFNEYAGTYKNALKTGTGISIIKDEDYQQLKEKVAGYLALRRYKNVIFSDLKNGFFVFAKTGDFQLPCQIILKYTPQAEPNKIRVDMVKASDELATDTAVDEDIQKIAEQLKS